MNDQELIEEAKSWQGTPWKHGIAIKGYGADCVQWLVTLGKDAGLISPDYKTIKYHQDWAMHNSHSVLEEELKKIAYQIKKEEMQLCDIIVVRYGKCGSHAALYIGGGKIIHAYLKSSIREDNLKMFGKRITSVWRLKG